MRFLFQAVDLLRHKARLRRWNPERASGRRGEDLAHRYLQSLGFRVVGRNWRSRSGTEVDIIAWDEDVLAFIEVKSRQTDEFGSPDRAVGREKESHVIRAAREYARRSGSDWSQVRFDVLTVVFTQPVRIELLRDVYRAAQPARAQ